MGILKKRCWYPVEIRTFNFIIEILLIPKKCEYKSNKERYGPFRLGNRLGVGQIHLELNQRDFTVGIKGTTDAVFIKILCFKVISFANLYYKIYACYFLRRPGKAVLVSFFKMPIPVALC